MRAEGADVRRGDGDPHEPGGTKDEGRCAPDSRRVATNARQPTSPFGNSKQCSEFCHANSITEQQSEIKRCSEMRCWVAMLLGVKDPAETTPDASANGSPAPEGRRARQRRELLQSVETVARRLLDSGGPGAVTMRSIAREVGVAPASLYTYFSGLDDVFTMLLLTSYSHLSEATREAVARFADEPPQDRAFIAVLAHRRWALDHRNEFNLLFTDVLPNYQAPEGGPTVGAQLEVFRPMLDAIIELGLADDEEQALEVGLPIWAAFHGAVALEVNHHLEWHRDPAGVHEKVVRTAIAAAGIREPSPDLRRRFT